MATPLQSQGLEFSAGVNFAKLSDADIQNAAQSVGMAQVIDLSYIEIHVHIRFPLVGAGPVRLNLILARRSGSTPDAGSAPPLAPWRTVPTWRERNFNRPDDAKGKGGCGGRVFARRRMSGWRLQGRGPGRVAKVSVY